jgi:hypothetical protein
MEVPRHWRLIDERNAHGGSICPNPLCETVHFFKKKVCPECGEIYNSNNISTNSRNKLQRNEIFIQQTPVPVEQVRC